MRWLRQTAAIAIAVVIAVFSAVPASAADGELSGSGQSAIADLRTCLASQSTLNVYYLIDSSRSLAVSDAGGPGSDPDNVRASILANSLDQLGTISEGVQVNWAAGFFSTEYSSAVGWTSWNEESADQLRTRIDQQTPSGYTNWPAALEGAQRALAAQQGSAPGCQMLVWLTDGQLDIQAPDGQQQEDFDALNALCGAQLSSAGAAASDGGLFNEFRQSGVVVIGALLAVDETTSGAATAMQALVEGSAPGTDVTCGENPVPDSYAHGAFVEASAPDSLARVFLQLSAQVGGGYPQPFEADGSFWIDEGVASFRIILAGDWTLTPPEGSGLDAASASSAQDWASVTTSDGATVIDVDTRAAASDGHWRLDAGDARSLFLFSGLRIEFDDSNSLELNADGSSSQALHATVVGADGSPVALDVFGEAAFSAWIVGDDGSRTPLAAAEVDEATGEITIPIDADLTAAQIVVAASIDPLTTEAHALSLAPVTTEKTIALQLPKEFPKVATLPVSLSDLEGANGTATGEIVLTGPTEGGDGTVCFPGDPAITSDSAHRDAWAWTLAGGLDSDGCITVPQGGEVRIPISAANQTPADSSVQASLPVVFRSAEGTELTQNVTIQFRSTHPVNTGAVLLIAIGLLALGVLLPLLLLWLVNWLTTRIDVPKNTQRAAFPITIAAGGNRVQAPAGGSALSDAFVFRTPSDGERSISDPNLGTIRARVSWFPLKAPWYEVAAPVGAALLTARAGRTTTGAADATGALRFAKLPLSRFWAVVVDEAQLRRTMRGDEVTGTLVIYHRISPSEEGQHAQRISEVEVDASLAEAVNRARAALQEREAKASPPSRTAPPTSGPPASGAGTPPVSAPPRPSSPPPRPTTGGTAPGGPPPRTGGPVAPPSTPAPPGRGTGSAPPPLPGRS